MDPSLEVESELDLIFGGKKRKIARP